MLTISPISAFPGTSLLILREGCSVNFEWKEGSIGKGGVWFDIYNPVQIRMGQRTTKAVLLRIQNSCGCEASSLTVTSRLVLSPQELICPWRSSNRYRGMPTSRRVSFSFFRTPACTHRVRSRCSTPSSSVPCALTVAPSSFTPLIPNTPLMSRGTRLHSSSTFSKDTFALRAVSFLIAMKNSRGLEKALSGKILLRAVREDRRSPSPMPLSAPSLLTPSIDPSDFRRSRSALNLAISLLTQSSLCAIGSMALRKGSLLSSPPSPWRSYTAASFPTTECEYSESGLTAGWSPKMPASASLMASMSSVALACVILAKRGALSPRVCASGSWTVRTAGERNWLMRMFILARSMSSASFPTYPISPSKYRRALKSTCSGDSFLASSSVSMLQSQRCRSSGPSATSLRRWRAWTKSAVWKSYLRFQPQGLNWARLLTSAWRQAMTKARVRCAGCGSGRALLTSLRQRIWLRRPAGCSMRYLWQWLVTSGVRAADGAEMRRRRKWG